MLLRSHGGGNCSGDRGAHEGGPNLHPTGLMRIYGVVEVSGPESLDPPVSQTTVLIVPKLALVCSSGSPLQMMKSLKCSVGNR